jgi:hypothetical protein
MDSSRADLLIQYALAAAAQEDAGSRELGPIHLVKYVYLGDVAYAQAHDGETYTGAAWKFYHFGPWSAEIFRRVEPATVSIGAAERVFASRYQEDARRWSLRDPGKLEYLEEKIPWEVTRVLRRAVHEFGSDTKSLLHHVYQTEPMLKAAPGDPLSFRPARPEGEPGPPVAPPAASLSKTAVKKLKARIADRLREKREERAAGLEPPPRYDEVFLDGQQWLDSLTEIEPIEGSRGQLHFSEEIWTSPARGDRDLP